MYFVGIFNGFFGDVLDFNFNKIYSQNGDDNLMKQLYKILQMFTNEWELIDEKAVKLTKEECDHLLNYYVSEGVNPNHLRAVCDND